MWGRYWDRHAPANETRHRERTPPRIARLLKRLCRIEELLPADQRAVLKLVDGMLDTRRRSAPAPRSPKRNASCARSPA